LKSVNGNNGNGDTVLTTCFDGSYCCGSNNTDCCKQKTGYWVIDRKVYPYKQPPSFATAGPVTITAAYVTSISAEGVELASTIGLSFGLGLGIPLLLLSFAFLLLLKRRRWTRIEPISTDFDFHTLSEKKLTTVTTSAELESKHLPAELPAALEYNANMDGGTSGTNKVVLAYVAHSAYDTDIVHDDGR
jgi:hypothetical protein